MIGLPLAGYVFLYLAHWIQEQEWRAAAIGAATIWGILVVLITELLSLPRELTRSGIAGAWLVADVAALVYLWVVAHRKVRLRSLRDLCAACCQTIPRPTLASVVVLSGVAILVLLVAIAALWSPPNTWDVMAYHMPRVIHWIEQRSVQFYQTSDLRQLYMPPWTEFGILHVHVLFGGDHFDNLIQWCSFLGSVVGVSLIAQLIGANYRGQLLAGVFCATIPQGILEASGAKNDYVVAFWLVALTYYLHAFRHHPRSIYILGIGGALGLAWLTKGTAYLFSMAILLAVPLAWPWKTKMVLLKRLPWVVVLALGLNIGHFVRNYSLSGSPLGPSAEGPSAAFKLTNDEITMAALMSNILRNMALHLSTPIGTVNLALEHWVGALIRGMGDDVNNPRTTWTGTIFHIPEMSRHEASAGNPLHVGFILLTLVFIIARADLRTSTDTVISAAGLILAFLLFCALLRWQPWHTRLHLPLFVLWSPVVGMVLARAWPVWVTTGISVLLLLLSVPMALGNQLRPLAFGSEFGMLRQERRALYFAENRELEQAYRPVAEFVNDQGCDTIGLDIPSDSPTYPLLALLGADTGKKRIRYIEVRNVSAQYAEREDGFLPCVVVCIRCWTMIEKWPAYLARVGPATIFQQIAVFSAKGAKPAVDLSGRACVFTFLSGWHGRERDGQAWWHWMGRYGEIQVLAVRNIDVVMQSEVYSIQQPNTVDILVNGEPVVSWEIMEDVFKTSEPVAFHLQAGENILLFASRNAGVHTPTDSRQLALRIKNLRMVSADGTIICERQP